jgi:hypothetical protein
MPLSTRHSRRSLHGSCGEGKVRVAWVCEFDVVLLVPNSWIPEVDSDSEARVGVPWFFPAAVTVGISRAKALSFFPPNAGFFFSLFLRVLP